MSLARVHNPLSLALIRRLGDAGGPRGDQVAAELDSLIAWARLSPRRIHFDTDEVGNAGAGLDVLHTFSLDTPDRLATDGDELDIVYAGTFAANNTDKRVNAFFGGSAYEGITPLDIDAGSWRIAANIIRLSSTSVRVSSIMTWFALHADSATPPTVTSFGAGFLSVTRCAELTGLADLGANATTVEVQGEGGANDDVVQKLSIIRLTQQ